MQPVCAILDNTDADKPYSAALAEQQRVVENPALTASARMLASMREQSQPFAKFALTISDKHAHFFRRQELDVKTAAEFDAMASASHAKQRDLESQAQLPFAEFLQQYFSQSCY
jgi:glutamate--cysteine ligase